MHPTNALYTQVHILYPHTHTARHPTNGLSLMCTPPSNTLFSGGGQQAASTRLSIEQLRVVVHVVGQQAGGGAHQQAVGGRLRAQRPGAEAGDGLVDVEERNGGVLAARHHAAGAGPVAGAVRAVDEDLRGAECGEAVRERPAPPPCCLPPPLLPCPLGWRPPGTGGSRRSGPAPRCGARACGSASG